MDGFNGYKLQYQKYEQSNLESKIHMKNLPIFDYYCQLYLQF